MANTPPPAPSDRSQLLIDFPLRLFTALRTIRLYPAANPQVQRTNEMVVQSFQALQESGDEDVIVLGISDQKLMVCGEPLGDKDQAKPQIKGLRDLFSRAKMHSLSFSSAFSFEECIGLTQTLSSLLEKKEVNEPVAAMLDKAGILSVTADAQRYVAIHDGEQVVREELLGAGLNISDEELANFVLGGDKAVQGVSKELIEELINRLPASGMTSSDGQNTEELTNSVIELLKDLKLSRNTTDGSNVMPGSKPEASILNKLDPALLAKLVANLPENPDSSVVLAETISELSPERLNALVAKLVAEQPLVESEPGSTNLGSMDAAAMPAALQRLIEMHPEQATAINQAAAQNLDAKNLLLRPETTLAELPQHLLERLHQPEWSAPVLASAAEQLMSQQKVPGGPVDFSAFQHMLGQYEQLLDHNQQAQVAKKAGAQLASMEGAALGNMLTQKFKGLLGEQLYQQVMGQVSDELLDETVEQLTPIQLNRMVAILTSDIPLHINKEGDPNFEPATDSVLLRLANTKKGAEIKRAVDQNIDARTLLVAPETTVAELPEHLRQRLMQPEWSAPVLASAAQQVMDNQAGAEQPIDFSAFNRMLAQYEQVLDRDQQAQVAKKAGAQLASMEGAALGNMLTQKFKGLLGEQLYEQVMGQVSDELLDETVEQLTPIQLNRMVAILTSDIPLHINKEGDPNFEPATDSVLLRLANTKKGAEIKRAVDQNIDARTLLVAPETTVAELPEHLRQRLMQPEWSAPVLASAAQQVMDNQAGTEHPIDFSAFNRMLAQYEQVLDRDQQAQVAKNAGAQLASMEGAALGNMLTQKFKGLLGEQLYEQLMGQVSDELLDETVEQLTPIQLNRMVAILTSDIPLHINKEGDPNFEPATDSVLLRLANTKKGAEIKRAVDQNIDARTLLVAPETTVAELPEHLRQRLMQPEWSAPVLASAAQQVMDNQAGTEQPIDFSAFNRMLAQYEQVLDRDQQAQVAKKAGAQLATMEGAALGNMLTQKFKGLLGEQLYEQIMGQVSDELLDETVEQLTPIQLNRMVAILTSDIPLHINKEGDPDFEPATDSVLLRLASTKKGAEIKRAVDQNIDARTLLVAPETTVAELPEHLRQRLMQPEWSAPVLASAAQQVMDNQAGTEQPIDFSAFNRMLAQYEQVLDRDQQAQVARQAGTQLASMEGVALGNILTQKFRGLFGEQLFEQIMGQVSDELLDETVEQLTPKQLNRMVATLTSEIPLHIGKEDDANFQLASDSILIRLAQTQRGAEIKESLAQSLEARELLVAPETTVAELPEYLRQRLLEPEWSAPMLAQAAIQAANPHETPGQQQVDFSGFNRMLAQYEQVLDQEQQTQVIRQTGAQLASMEGAALGNILSQKFKGLFGEHLYAHVMEQVSDELLDETVEHLNSKQLNRMVATLTSDIPLQISKEADPDFVAADDAILKRLARTKKGSEIEQIAAHNIAAHHLLQAAGPSTQLPEQIASRLHQPEWSAPVLVSATRQLFASTEDNPDAPMHLADFEQMLERYNTLLSQDEQLQVASKAGGELASLEDRELGMILVKKYKNLFGEQLYQQIIAQLSPERIERLTAQFQDLAEGRIARPADLDAIEVEEAYQGLMETVRSEKMRAIIELHQEQKKQKEQQRKNSLDKSRDNLLQGRFEELESHSFAEAIPEEIRQLLLNDDEATADNLMMQLAIGMQHNHPRVRENAFEALAATSEHLARIGQWDRFTKLLPALKQGIEKEGVTPKSSEQALAAISGLAEHYLTQEDYVSAYEILHFLQQLTQARVPHVREQARDVQKVLCSQDMLAQLLDRFFHSEKQQHNAGKILVELGLESAKFQLKQLFESESRYERKRLLGLIKQTGNPAVSLLIQQLRKDAPWYVLRNIIRLLGEVGEEKHFTKVQPFIRHSDPRVQQEVIATAAKIAGDNLKDFLLEALQLADDSLKIRVINHIATIHDERFVRPLTDLLESSKPFLGKSKTDLQISTCKALGALGSKRATGSLSRVAQSKNMLGLSGYADEVRVAAQHALQQIRRANQDQHEEHSLGMETNTRSTALPQVSDREIQEEEKSIFKLAQEGKHAEAKQQLLDLIGTVAHAGDLATAERLRERIYELDETAFPDIIRSEAIIEQEKQGVCPEDLEIWAELTDQLGTREFQIMHQAFSERKLQPEETLVTQGDKNDGLFFINQGSIKASHLVDDRELFITSLSRGQLAGENFFTPSLWTVTLSSLTPSRIYILPQAALAEWKEKYPGLRAKLYDYYRTRDTISGMLKKKGLNRRKDERFTLARKVQVQPISSNDAPIGRGFRSETADISLGGLAFLIRISRQENARLLLGRRMQIIIPVGGKIGKLTFKGLVIGVQPYRQLIGNFSVHFKFDRPLDHEELQAILG